MNLLGCLFTILLSAFLIVLAFGLSILHFLARIFGVTPSSSQPTQSASSSQPSSQPSSSKVFSDEEGEYIDFEEI